METKYIIMSGEEMPFVSENADFKQNHAVNRWTYWYYQSGAYLFDSKEEAHSVANQMGISMYSLLESYIIPSA